MKRVRSKGIVLENFRVVGHGRPVDNVSKIPCRLPLDSSFSNCHLLFNIFSLLIRIGKQVVPFLAHFISIPRIYHYLKKGS